MFLTIKSSKNSDINYIISSFFIGLNRYLLTLIYPFKQFKQQLKKDISKINNPVYYSC